MATTRPFAYNTGATISGTIKLGNLAIGASSLNYASKPGGVQWWSGPDEDLGYVIAQPVPSGTQPNPLGISASVGFWRSGSKTDASFLDIVNTAYGQNFSSGASAAAWLSTNGYWTSYVAGYTYYRWQITSTKTTPPDANCTQAAEFVFQLNGADQSMSGATVTNPGGSSPAGEEPPKLIDNNLTTKALDLNFVTNGKTDFIIQFSTQKSFNGYRWATANDSEGRDPRSWTVAGSNDGTNWTTLHTVAGFTASVARNTYQTAQTY